MINQTEFPCCTIIRLDEYPDLLGFHRHHPQRYPFLLESVAHGTSQSRYDILMAFPGDRMQLSAGGELTGSGAPPGARGFLHGLDLWWHAQQQTHDTATPPLPFCGGWFLYLAYELAAEIEPVLNLPGAATPTGHASLPQALAVRCPAAIIRDHQQRCTYLVAERGEESCLAQMRADFEHTPRQPGVTPSLPAYCIHEEQPGRYLQGVEKVRRYITDGDVFQVNLSRKWEIEFAAPVAAADLYQRLRLHNPAPFAGLACLEQGTIISSSPERLLQTRGRSVQTRPIAGTRPRSEDPANDRSMSRELLGHPKEQAEHIMLIDLERNDLGRVCETGSVRVDELMALESYAHVHHIVSNVQGTLRKEVTPGEVIAALFPGGTITGCPKIRCMEIIAELEQEARGAYTGSMGYLNRNGDMDLNILIRTLVHDGTQVRLRAGAGIVHDSIPANELEETRAKAKGLLLALQGRRQERAAS